VKMKIEPPVGRSRREKKYPLFPQRGRGTTKRKKKKKASQKSFLINRPRNNTFARKRKRKRRRADSLFQSPSFLKEKRNIAQLTTRRNNKGGGKIEKSTVTQPTSQKERCFLSGRVFPEEAGPEGGREGGKQTPMGQICHI